MSESEFSDIRGTIERFDALRTPLKLPKMPPDWPGLPPDHPRMRPVSETLGPLLDDAALTITAYRWIPTDDERYGSLFGPQRLAARMFGRINPHWYLDRSDE